MREIGAYWTKGNLKTTSPILEAYLTCARCGCFVNDEERHEEWHRHVEGVGDDV
jgi:hypothetical protein